MEETLMDHRALRRLVLEQKLIDYVYASEPDRLPRYFECGPEFGVAHLWFKGSWRIKWVFVEECPLDLSELPKGEV